MKVVAIGGGHGAAATLRAALMYSDSVSAVVTVADDGGSSGRLAKELGVLPMGDIRNCLAALAPDSLMVDMFQHRFEGGRLDGHAVGNLMIAAWMQETGSFIEAIRQAARMIGSRGRVVPPTMENVTLISEIEGERIEGQVAVATATGRISYVALDPPDPKAYPEAIDLISEADQIVLGPGSLFTSVIPNLLVPEVREAYLAAQGRKIFICNLVAPAGETADFDAAAHLAALYAHLGEDCVDVVVAHEGTSPIAASPPVTVDKTAFERWEVSLIRSDFLPDDRSPRHDPAKLAAVLQKLTQ
ncbi:MAG TPA: uridine diphosphate-N-acetylglucosamine-binding protein YvcK [Actinomycetota bacterium]|nr:uridine diphosphate-N-acetylglucosamine-binding protein YvcK [Actinomycetota bacterium]